MTTTSDSPTCEIITIGTELLLGQIMDTNTSYLAQELGRIGVTIRFRTAVGDRLEEIIRVVQNAVERCDMVMATGGLGPTLDDLTREAVARVAGVDLEFKQDLMDQIEEYFRRAGYQMPENNRRQAYVPAASQVILNPVGTAPGFIIEVDGKPIICLPGVPTELKYLWGREVSPWLQKRFSLVDQRVTYRVLKVVGIGESGVDRLIGDLMGVGKNPEVGLLASPGEIKIRITATSRGDREAQDLIRPVEEEIGSRLGKKIFGSDEDTLEGVIDALLIQKGLTLAILETFSAGLAAQRLYQIPSSRLLDSRVIPDRKRLFQLLGKGNGLLDIQAASTLAQRVREMGKADVGLSIVGFPEKKEESYTMNGFADATGNEIEKHFSWQMGGHLRILQERGAVIGLNTLRLALLSAG
ncbi:MAG: CinA family nicotinamide mononucleotide deamidase-related protein [Deltaproteobacteria bacterium]|nr:MAG: CinA family nicotinamide mononucleotide deamidase-related protein [Deltaproteobacteria bacterium]